MSVLNRHRWYFKFVRPGRYLNVLSPGFPDRIKAFSWLQKNPPNEYVSEVWLLDKEGKGEKITV